MIMPPLRMCPAEIYAQQLLAEVDANLPQDVLEKMMACAIASSCQTRTMCLERTLESLWPAIVGARA